MIPEIESIPAPLFYGGAFALASLIGMGFAGILRWRVGEWSEMTLTYGSLFSGIGGMDLGFDRAGMTCKWQVEIDDYCNRVLAKHWPNVRRYRDVREVGEHNLESVDVITGGFPCQPHSVAGKRKGAADDRNLWPEYLRIITELRPTWVVGENVPGIVTTYLDTVLSDLEGAGYEVATFNLPAVAFDAPHRRERIFVVADANDKRLEIWKSESSDNGAQQSPTFRACGWPTEPNVGRVAHGVSNRVDRLRGLGNAVVPQVAEFVARLIVELP